MMIPHSICKNCGFYRGKEYIPHGKPAETQPVETTENA